MSPPSTDDLKVCPTVLVIHDDDDVRSILETLLETYGFQVALARDGRQGLAAFHTIEPDVVLADVMMPEHDGIATIARIRRERPDARIVAMSDGAGVGSADDLATAIELGADRAIEDPFEVDELVAALRAAARSAPMPTIAHTAVA